MRAPQEWLQLDQPRLSVKEAVLLLQRMCAVDQDSSRIMALEHKAVFHKTFLDLLLLLCTSPSVSQVRGPRGGG